MRRCPSQNQVPRGAGFTLIEVLVAVAIFAVGVTAVLESFQMSMLAMERSHDVMVSSRLASQLLDDLILSCRAGFAPQSGTGQFDAPLDDYQWNVEAREQSLSSSASGTTAEGLYDVELLVWRHDVDNGLTLKTRLAPTEAGDDTDE